MHKTDIAMLHIRLDSLELSLNHEKDPDRIGELHLRVEELEAELFELTNGVDDE